MKIYLINLDRQPERLSSAKDELSRIGVTPERINAVDMLDESMSHSDYVTNGVRACWLSHLKVLEQISRGNEPIAMIVEDDLRILNTNRIKAFLGDDTLHGWDLVQFGFITPGFLNKLIRLFRNFEHSFFWTIFFISSHFSFRTQLLSRLRVRHSGGTPRSFVPDDFLPGTHAYAISREMATAVLSLNSPQFLSADDFYMALAHMRTFKVIRSRRSLIGQKNFQGFGGERFKAQETK
jgi:GR25 family glycosyltransferase involved in LPS biosynthesis